MWARSPFLHVRYIHTHDPVTVLAAASQAWHKSDDAQVFRLVSLLKECDTLFLGRQVHDLIIKQARYGNNTFLSNFLIEMYGHFGCLDDAQSVFDHMRKHNLHSWNILMNVYGHNSSPFEASFVFGRMPLWDVVSWTSIIMAFSHNGFGKEALNLFFEMLMLAFVPNKVTFLCSLEACTSLYSLVQGQDIHIAIVKHGYEMDRVLGTALISLYGWCGCLPHALKVFRGMNDRDIASWNATIASLVNNGEFRDALNFIHEMQLEGFNPDHVSFVSVFNACRSLHEGLDMHAVVIYFGMEQNAVINNTLIDMYGKHDCLPDALSVFKKMLHRTAVSWNVLITAFADNLYGKEAIQTFFQMEMEEFMLDRVSFLGAVRGCTSLRTLELGHLVHTLLMESVYGLDAVIGNTIITMYGWCGSVDDASVMFHRLSHPNIVTWSSVIGMYCRDGQGEEALGLFYHMHAEGFKPNEALLVCALEACTMLGAYELGQMVHAYVVEVGVEVGVDKVMVLENSILAFYGKCGNLLNAWAIFSRMDKRDVISWTSIITGFSLSGCSKEALDLLCRMQHEGLMPDKATFLCILSAFNHDGEVDRSKHLFVLMIQDFDILDNNDHFLCMIDLLGRAGLLDEAEGLIKEATPEIFCQACLCLLGACKIHGDIKRGADVADQILSLDPNTPSVHVMLWNLYATVGRRNDAALIREALRSVRTETEHIQPSPSYE